jgi:hypothetical protein
MGMGMNPFGEDVMTIIMGIDPSEPGMHGPMKEPCPSDDAIGLVTKIRDMCDEWLCSAGKNEGQADKSNEPEEKPDDNAFGEDQEE